jgi:hypothetical protein
MKASTAVSTIANDLGAYWSGMVDADQASVVFIWPDRQKAHLSFKLEDDQLLVEMLCGAQEKVLILDRALEGTYT